MDNVPAAARYELLYVIVNRGTGSRVLHLAKQCGITGGTITLGRGTVRNRFLEFLALTDIRKEIVLMMAESGAAEAAIDVLGRALRLFRPNRGIAFRIPVAGVCGARSCSCNKADGQAEEENTVYQSVMVIVDKGKGEAVVEAAVKAGAGGATIINARGSGIHETSRVFAMDIEPEKEIVLMITKSEKTEAIVASIRDNFQIEKPGKGVIFVQNVKSAYGLAD